MSAVGKWLDANGLGQYAEAFADNDVTFDLIASLSDDDLRELGLSLGHRKRFARAVEVLDGEEAEIAQDDASDTVGDRRPVTVLFADISGFTRLSGELGAEATRDMLNGFFEVADKAITDEGGRIDKHIGDEVMAVFGAPRAHANDPERAVRAALAIRAGTDALDPPLPIHIGIASGTVVASGTGSDAHREYAVIGESVNLASRLCGLAAANEVVVSDEVRRAVADTAEATERETGDIKGFDAPVRAWAVDQLREGGAALRPLVGRSRELQQFESALQEMQKNRRGQIFILRGEAGIGKTRLTEELAMRARDAGIAIHRTAILDFGSGTGDDSIHDLIASLLDLPAGEERLNALSDLFRDGQLPQSLKPYMIEALGLPQPAETRAIFAAEDPDARRHGVDEAVGAAIAYGADQPLMLAIEDAHWADTAVRDRLAAVATRIADHPVLMVLTTRIENDPFDAGWRAAARGVPITTSDLGPLTAEDAAELTGALANLDADILADCIDRADGNPLFLEHLARSAAEDGSNALPDSVQSIVLAQVDRLPADEREVLQVASVFGQRFTASGVASLLDQASVDVESLAERGLVRRDGGAWRFAHALVRDGVYESLLTSRAQGLHASAADWYATRDATLHADHLAKAGDPGTGEAYLSAARLQAGAYRYTVALDLTERGLQFGENPDTRVALELLRADINRDSGDIRTAIAQYRDVSETGASVDAQRSAAIGEVACLRVAGQIDEGLARLDSIDMSGASELDQARFHHYRGALRFSVADIEGCVSDQEAALAHAQAAGDPEWEAMALGGIGDAHYAAGRMGAAYERFLACVDLAADHGLGRIELSNRHMVGVCRRYMNENGEALEDVSAAREFAAQVGNIRSQIVTGIIQSEMLMEGGRAEEAAAILEADAGHITDIGNQRLEAYNTIQLARARCLLGDVSTAYTHATHALALSRDFGMVFIGARILGVLGLVAPSEAERKAALAEGAELITNENPIAHNALWFYRDAIEATLDMGDWDAAEACCDTYAAYTAAEPLPWTDFFIARGRALAALGRNSNDPDAQHAAASALELAEQCGFIQAAIRLADVAKVETVD